MRRLVADVADVRRHRVVTRRSAKTFHCWVNCGRRFGSHARTWPDGWSCGFSSAKPVVSVPGRSSDRSWHGRLEEERRVERQPQVRARALHVLRDAVGAAHDPAFDRPPGGAEPRLEALLVGLVERAALAAAVLREDLLPGRQVEVSLTVVLLDDRLRVGPAHAEIQRQRRRRLEVVLDESAMRLCRCVQGSARLPRPLLPT